MDLTWSNPGLFRAPGFIVSPVGRRERRGKKWRREGGEKGNRKGKEGRKEEGTRKYWRKEKKKEFYQN